MLVRSLAFAVALASIPGELAAQNVATPSAVMKTYCVSCHGTSAPQGGFSLNRLDVTDPARDAEVWERVVRPKGANDYRVASGNATGEAQRILVRTKVAFLAPKPPFARLRGSVRPAGSGILVTLARRRADGSFVRVGTTRTAADGSFSFAVGRPGTYRARADAGANLLVGSALVTIPPA